MKRLRLTLLATFWVSSLGAQEPRFEGRSRLVTLPATVTDSQGRFVEGLDESNFLVIDNGHARRVKVDTIGTGVAPIALMVVVQTSGISAAVIEKIQKAQRLIQPLIIGDRGCAGLVSFAEEVTWLQDCASDADQLDKAFARLRPKEYRRARLLDAVSEAIDRLSEHENMRRVLLLVSESHDRGSEAELAAVTSDAQSTGVTVYAATYSTLATGFTSRTQVFQQAPPETRPIIPNPFRTWTGGPPSKYNPLIVPPEDRMNLRAAITELVRLRRIDSADVLTGGTGGRTLPFTRQRGLEDSLEKLARELHAQYLLSFVPDAPGAAYHTLEVLISDRTGLRVRSRPGYWLEAESPVDYPATAVPGANQR